MKIPITLFALLYHPHPPQVLQIVKSCTADVFGSYYDSFASGMDLRPQQNLEPTLQTLQCIHDRHELYMRLTDFRTPFLVKELFAREYLEEDMDFAPNIYSGGLLDDWDFTLDPTLH